MNKKIIAVMLVMTMIIGNCIVVLAADSATWDGTTYTPDNNGNTTGKDAIASVNITDDGTERICVEITWGALTYDITGTGKWNPETMNYDITSPTCNPTSTGTSDIITIKNKSNKQVTADIGWTQNPTFNTTYGISGDTSITVNTDSEGENDRISLEAASSEGTPTDHRYIQVTAPITKAPSLTATNVIVGRVKITLNK